MQAGEHRRASQSHEHLCMHVHGTVRQICACIGICSVTYVHATEGAGSTSTPAPPSARSQWWGYEEGEEPHHTVDWELVFPEVSKRAAAGSLGWA